MGTILKFLLTIFALGTESRAERGEREWNEAERENRVGSKFFGDLLAGTIGAILMALFIYGILTTGLAGLVTAVVVYEALMLVALIALVLTILLRPEYGFGARLGVYLVLAAWGIMKFVDHHDKPRTSQTTRNEAPAQPVEEKPFARAEWIVRDELVAKVDQLRADAQAQWKADLVAAGATAAAGVVPPMLEVTPKGPGIWQVKNLSKTTLCVRIARVHCSLDTVQECSELLAGSTRRLTLEVSDLAGCASILLEYRVGKFTQPEPSWWSTTALEELDGSNSLADRGHVKWTLEQLRNEITALDGLLAQPDRAARWRRELRQYDSRVEAE